MANAVRIRNSIRRLSFDNDEMTQQELENRVGCTRQTIIALETGQYVPPLGLAFEMGRVFGVTIEDIFQYEE